MKPAESQDIEVTKEDLMKDDEEVEQEVEAGQRVFGPMKKPWGWRNLLEISPLRRNLKNCHGKAF